MLTRRLIARKDNSLEKNNLNAAPFPANIEPGCFDTRQVAREAIMCRGKICSDNPINIFWIRFSWKQISPIVMITTGTNFWTPTPGILLNASIVLVKMLFLCETVSMFTSKCMEVHIFHDYIQYTNIVPYLLVSSRPHLVRAFLGSREHGQAKTCYFHLFSVSPGSLHPLWECTAKESYFTLRTIHPDCKGFIKFDFWEYI